MLVLLFFLRRVRLTLLIGLAIPLSLLLTGIWIAATGGTLNLLAMIGVTVAIGMLVDDAIVVVESIQQKREEGLSADGGRAARHRPRSRSRSCSRRSRRSSRSSRSSS